MPDATPYRSRDANGSSYLSEASTDKLWQVVVPVAQGLVRSEHTVEIAPAGPVNLDGVLIPAVEQPGLPWATLIPLFILGTFCAFLSLREIRLGRTKARD